MKHAGFRFTVMYRLLLLLLIPALLLAAYVWMLKPSRAAVQEYADPAEVASASPGGAEVAMVQLAVVQTEWDLNVYRSENDFRRYIEGIVERIRSRTDPSLPVLVAFPEDIGLPLVLMNESLDFEPEAPRTLQEAMRRFISVHLPEILSTRLMHQVGWARATWISQQEKIAKTYVQTFSQAARRYGFYIVAGSAPLQKLPIQDGKVTSYRVRQAEVYNTSYLFGPDGRILTAQKKVNLLPIEGKQGLDLSPGSLGELQVVETPFGTLAIAICLDGFQDDVLHRLGSLGGQILVQPSANPAQWSREQQLDWLNGSHRAVSNEGVFRYALNPMATGSIYDLNFQGQSAIFAQQNMPAGQLQGYLDLSPLSGFLTVADRPEGEEVLIVRVPTPSALP